MKDAQIAILDEPTSGLDPQATLELLDIIRDLKERGVSVLLSSHLLERVQSICDRVALFSEGNIVLMGTVRRARPAGAGRRLPCRSRGRRAGARGTACATVPGVSKVEAVGPNRVRLLSDRDVRPEAAAAVVGAGGRLLAALGRGAEPGGDLHPLLPERSGASARRVVMRREGSPWHGLGVVIMKELSDHLTSVRMRVLEWLVVLIALAALYGAIQQIRDVTAEDPFLFLRLFTTSREPLPSFVSFLSFLVPLIAIGLGFDAVNGEHNRRTLSRILSQPIYRDALLFGKFIAGLFTLSISLLALWLLVIGLGLFLLGVPPSARGDGARLHLPAGDDRLCGGVAGAGDAVLDRLPLGGDGGAGDARAVAVPDADLAGAGARDRRLAVAPSGNEETLDPRGAIPVAAVAEHAVRRDRAGDPQSFDAHARADLSEPAAGRRDRRAACRSAKA